MYKYILFVTALIPVLVGLPAFGSGIYTGQIENVICDIKNPLAGNTASPITNGQNLRKVLNGLKARLGCNAIRIYIDPGQSDPTQYGANYNQVLRYARQQLGLKIYANPLGTGKFGMTNDQWVDWIVAYANYWQPEFLAPFNESGWSGNDAVGIASQIASRLTYKPAEFIGPDAQKVESSISQIKLTPDLAKVFSIFGSHNAAGDTKATTELWQNLSALSAIPVWDTENPRAWSQIVDGQEVGVASVVASPTRAIVLYEAYPCAIDGTGQLTDKGNALMGGLLKHPRSPNANPSAAPGTCN